MHITWLVAGGLDLGWYSLDLLDGEDDLDIDITWRAVWTRQYFDRALDFRNAIFSRRDGAAAIYFSPAAWELAQAFGANACEKPLPAGLRLVAGDDRVWQLYFPEVAQPAASACGRLPLPSGFDELVEPTYPSLFAESFDTLI